MITAINVGVDKNSILTAVKSIKDFDFKTTINDPTEDFFYDRWIVKPEYRGSVWEEILSTLTFPIGEARVIILKPGSCYHSHTDIDDRYHLNLQGHYSYLIDLDNNKMFNTILDGQWYTMDTGVHHVAANFGSVDRIQLVVRHLLKKNKLKNPVNLKISPLIKDADKVRFIFDDYISCWLNKANKIGKISNFSTDYMSVVFDIENESIPDLKTIMPKEFRLEY